jgi:hypothetical protein
MQLAWPCEKYGHNKNTQQENSLKCKGKEKEGLSM